MRVSTEFTYMFWEKIIAPEYYISVEMDALSDEINI
jgi:hypothetical protein